MSASSRFGLIVFDWDGTLMDSEAKIVNCICAAAVDCGVTPPTRQAARQIIGLGLHEALTVLFPTLTPARRETLVEHYRRHFLIEDKTSMPLFPGVKAGIESLVAQGYALAVATGKARRGLRKVLAETETEHLFITTRCADEAYSKPHPQMLEDILAATGFARSETVMIGDTTYDMQMAQNADIARVGVTYGVHSRAQLLDHAPLACLDSFADVYRWLS